MARDKADRGCRSSSTLHCAGDAAVESERSGVRGRDVDADSGGGSVSLVDDRLRSRRAGVDLNVNAGVRRSPAASRARALPLVTGEPGPATTADVCQARSDLLDPTRLTHDSGALHVHWYT